MPELRVFQEPCEPCDDDGRMAVWKALQHSGGAPGLTKVRRSDWSADDIRLSRWQR
jgi:hypothetical protein